MGILVLDDISSNLADTVAAASDLKRGASALTDGGSAGTAAFAASIPTTVFEVTRKGRSAVWCRRWSCFFIHLIHINFIGLTRVLFSIYFLERACIRGSVYALYIV